MITRACQTFVALLLIAVIGIVPSGCASTQPRTLAEDLDIPEDNTRVLATKLDEYHFIFAAAIEQTLSPAILGSDDSLQRRRAAVTILRANQEIARARFHPDTLAAAADVWVLTAQFREFFRTGPGRDWFPTLDPSMAYVLERLEGAIAKIGLEAIERPFDPTADPATQRPELIARVVDEYPIEGEAMLRVSADVEVEALRKGEPPKDVFGSLSSIDRGVADIPRRLDVLTWTMPRFGAIYAGMVIDSRVDAFERSAFAERLDGALTSLHELPEVVQTERLLIMEAITSLRSDVLTDIDRQRRATMEYAEGLSVTLMSEIDWQREDSIARLDEALERAIDTVEARTDDSLTRAESAITKTVDDVDEQRQRTLDRLEALEATAVDDVTLALDHVVDRLFWRLAALLGAGLIGVFGLVLFTHKLHRRRLLEAALAGRAT